MGCRNGKQPVARGSWRVSINMAASKQVRVLSRILRPDGEKERIVDIRDVGVTMATLHPLAGVGVFFG